MSEQETDADSEQGTEPESEERQQETNGTGEESLEEIAEEPAGDVDDVFAAITGEGAAADTEDEADDSADEGSVDEELVEAIEERPAEAVAAGIVALQAEVEQLETELASERERADDLESRLKRKQADFQNYKKRQKERMEEEKQRATEDLITRLLDVRDNLQRALDQDEGTDIRGGVESTLEQFNQELDKENVEVIEPEPGSEVDPHRHEVLATIASDQPEDTVADLHRQGYEMADKVLRPAQVAVSDGSATDDEEE